MLKSSHSTNLSYPISYQIGPYFHIPFLLELSYSARLPLVKIFASAPTCVLISSPRLSLFATFQYMILHPHHMLCQHKFDSWAPRHCHVDRNLTASSMLVAMPSTTSTKSHITCHMLASDGQTYPRHMPCVYSFLFFFSNLFWP